MLRNDSIRVKTTLQHRGKAWHCFILCKIVKGILSFSANESFAPLWQNVSYFVCLSWYFDLITSPS